MQKYKLWLLFFFTIFSFTFAMIIWTIVKASQTPVHKDESFLQSYAEVDEGYNDMVISTKKFNDKYEVFIYVNDNKVPLSMDDIKISYRVFEKRTENKKLLQLGKNSLKVELKDKEGNIIQNPNINIRVIRAIDTYNDIDLTEFTLENGFYTANADIAIEGNWNITGFVEVDGLKGSLYIKTNTK